MTNTVKLLQFFREFFRKNTFRDDFVRKSFQHLNVSARCHTYHQSYGFSESNNGAAYHLGDVPINVIKFETGRQFYQQSGEVSGPSNILIPPTDRFLTMTSPQSIGLQPITAHSGTNYSMTSQLKKPEPIIPQNQLYKIMTSQPRDTIPPMTHHGALHPITSHFSCILSQ